MHISPVVSLAASSLSNCCKSSTILSLVKSWFIIFPYLLVLSVLRGSTLSYHEAREDHEGV